MKNYIIESLDKDGDDDVDLSDIYLIIIDLMAIERGAKITNTNKKINVLSKLKELIGDNMFNRFEPMLHATIDFIFQVAQSNKVLKKLKNKCICLKTNKKKI